MLGSSHGQRFTDWGRPQPSLVQIREQYGGSSISDEELLLRYMVTDEDLEAARAAGPARRSYDLIDPNSIQQLIEHALTLKRARHVSVRSPQGSFTLESAGS